MIVDSHAHLDDKRFNEDRKYIIEQIKKSGIDRVINIGSNIESSIDCLKLAKQYDFIYATVGIHPHDASSYNQDIEKKLYEMLKEEKVIGIGEIGLDFYYDFSPREKQIEVFISQLKIANKVKKPIVIHDREAHKIVLDTITNYKDKDIKGVFHSYSGSIEMTKQVFDLNLYISFNGISTFKNAKKVHEVIKYAPLDKILIETDSPYLTPEPYRGKRNDSRNVIYVAKAIANAKNISLDEVYKKTWENTNKLFNL